MDAAPCEKVPRAEILEYFRAVVVSEDMGTHPGKSLPVRLGVLALLALGLFVNAMRPITRPEMPQGMRRMSLLSEAATDDHIALPLPAILTTHVALPAQSVVAPRLLKIRRFSLQTVPLRHLKLPLARSATDSPAAH
jgi:hypothetical protein